MILNILEVISEDDFVLDPERYVDQANHQRRPIIIRAKDGREVVLLGLRDYSELQALQYCKSNPQEGPNECDG